MELKDEFHVQVAGSLLAVRVILAALLKNHPAPDKLLADIREVMRGPNAGDGQLPGPIQASFDERMQEFTSHLYTRIKPKGE